MARLFFLSYGLVGYMAAVGALVYLIFFIAGIYVPKTINSPALMELGPAGLVNIVLIVIWGLQHTIMARPGFKAAWTKFIPEPVERATYCIGTALVTYILVYFWQPMPNVIWDVSGTMLGTVLLLLYFTGWAVVLASSFMINHFHLFGLQQALSGARDGTAGEHKFVMPLLYKVVRHPIQLGVLISLWSAPTLTEGRLLLAVVFTIYIFVGLRYEERDLVDYFGDEYRGYKTKVPKVIPFGPKGK